MTKTTAVQLHLRDASGRKSDCEPQQRDDDCETQPETVDTGAWSNQGAGQSASVDPPPPSVRDHRGGW
ncbi:hypothetical protein PINS_up008023 [Pythium insidiosum]|nr:hypothetical protein PINS_up008023 [Pythium insidiosum]